MFDGRQVCIFEVLNLKVCMWGLTIIILARARRLVSLRYTVLERGNGRGEVTSGESDGHTVRHCGL